jgi:uncharacterized repeat protein (TIGR04042 family)
VPEMRFRIAWPDGSEEDCYSPSLVVCEHLAEGTRYALADFMARARTALTIASARVAAKYGHSCALALGQLARLERSARRFGDDPGAEVTCLAFLLPDRGHPP